MANKTLEEMRHFVTMERLLRALREGGATAVTPGCLLRVRPHRPYRSYWSEGYSYDLAAKGTEKTVVMLVDKNGRHKIVKT